MTPSRWAAASAVQKGVDDGAVKDRAKAERV